MTMDRGEVGAVMATGFISGWSGFMIGAAVGAAVGVIVGLLIAPKPGRETRAMLGERLGQAGEAIRSKIE